MISPASCSYLAAKMPRLRKVQLKLWDNEKQDSELRKRNRNELAKSMHLFPSSVRELRLDFPRDPPQNESFVPENILGSAAFDLFSVCLRDLSQQLTTISLDAMIGKELFWPLKAENITSTNLPYWPNLTTYKVEFSGTTPAGTWLLEEDPNRDEDDELFRKLDYSADLPEHLQPAPEDRDMFWFRRKAAPELIRDIYISAGLAAQRMPRLQRMQLRCNLNRALHDFDYVVSGKSASATWRDYVGVEPEEEVFRVWRDAAFQHTGVENGVEFRRTATTDEIQIIG